MHGGGWISNTLGKPFRYIGIVGRTLTDVTVATRASTIENDIQFYNLTSRNNLWQENLTSSWYTYPVTGTRAADDLPPIIMLVALLVVVEPEETTTVGPEVTRRWALGEEGGGGRRITDTTLCVCSHIRRKRRMLPAISYIHYCKIIPNIMTVPLIFRYLLLVQVCRDWLQLYFTCSILWKMLRW